MKTAVVYWSGTGNTEIMANFSAAKAEEFESIAFGCPSMGDEQLEEAEFEPMFISCIPVLQKKKIGLFGSYGWGDGAWMRSWEEMCRNNGIVTVNEGVICCGAPDDGASEELMDLGKALA